MPLRQLATAAAFLLLQTPRLALSRASTSEGSGHQSGRIQPAAWFADSEHLRSGVQAPAWEPGRRFPFRKPYRASRPPRWFHEGGSGGHDNAYQTHYPALERSRQGFRPRKAGGNGDGSWRQTQQGWALDYRDTKAKLLRHQVGPKSAVWFDRDRTLDDLYGRQAAPPQFTELSESVELASSPAGAARTDAAAKKAARKASHKKGRLDPARSAVAGSPGSPPPAGDGKGSAKKGPSPAPKPSAPDAAAKPKVHHATDARPDTTVKPKVHYVTERNDDSWSGGDASLNKMVEDAFHPIVFNKRLGPRAPQAKHKKIPVMFNKQLGPQAKHKKGPAALDERPGPQAKHRKKGQPKRVQL